MKTKIHTAPTLRPYVVLVVFVEVELVLVEDVVELGITTSCSASLVVGGSTVVVTVTEFVEDHD